MNARAPVRIDFAGGWSDVPAFADEVGGAVVNVAISHYVSVDVRRHDGGIELVADELGQRVSVESVADLEYDGVLDLHKAAAKMKAADHVRISSSSSVPPGSGLGTSGAMDVALIAALSAHQGLQVTDRTQLAEDAFHLEAIELGLMGGRQDQYASAFGGFLSLDFHSNEVRVRRLDLGGNFVDELKRAMVLVYTGQTHFSSATHERVWARYHDGSSTVIDALYGLKDLAARAVDALESADLESLADVLNHNWSFQQALHPSIATQMTTVVESAARNAGALGAKATGAGAGGCMIFIGEPDARQSITRAVLNAGATVLEYQFDMEGVHVSECD